MTVHLAVAIVAAPNPSTTGDLVVYLGRRPGGDVIKAFGAGTVSSWIVHEVGNRELIYLGQRGAGFSDPSLRCPEWLSGTLTLLGQTATTQQSQAMEAQVLQPCYTRLTAAGLHLADYTTYNAADMYDLLSALGRQ